MPTIQIDITTFEQALNLQNVAALHHDSVLANPVEGCEEEKTAIMAMWRDIYLKAIEAVDEFKGETHHHEQEV